MYHHIGFALTSFNRKDLTLRCLKHLLLSIQKVEAKTTIVLLDDMSGDGTALAVKATFPQVIVLHGNGNLFWAGGMRSAFSRLIQEDCDIYCWLNDDTFLFEDAIERMLATYTKLWSDSDGRLLLSGSVASPTTGKQSYGGGIMTRSLIPQWISLEPSENPQRCNLTNGNFLMISRLAAIELGNISKCFTHALGDYDYSLRAESAKIPTFIAPGYFGECETNNSSAVYLDDSLTALTRWALMRSPKGLPFVPWALFTRRHMGFFWLVFFLNPYVKFWLGIVSRFIKTAISKI